MWGRASALRDPVQGATAGPTRAGHSRRRAESCRRPRTRRLAAGVLRPPPRQPGLHRSRLPRPQRARGPCYPVPRAARRSLRRNPPGSGAGPRGGGRLSFPPCGPPTPLRHRSGSGACRRVHLSHRWCTPAAPHAVLPAALRQPRWRLPPIRTPARRALPRTKHRGAGALGGRLAPGRGELRPGTARPTGLSACEPYPSRRAAGRSRPRRRA
jgi:hypothetical protein